MQKDLFGTAAVAAMPDTMSAKLSFLDRYRMSVRLDQALFVLIGLLVVYVLVFSFGVETGKRYAMAELKAERLKHERMVDELRDKVFASPAAVQDSSSAVIFQKTVLAHGAKVQTVKGALQKTLSEESAVSGVSATEENAAKTANAADFQGGKFTIQTMTIASKLVAEKEIQRLAQKGMKGFIIPKGKMNMICINAFESREKASRSLKELKTQRLVPSDAYVRPVAA